MTVAADVLDAVEQIHQAHRRWMLFDGGIDYVNAVKGASAHSVKRPNERTPAYLFAGPACTHDAALVWVTDEMVDLLVHAAESLVPYPYTSNAILPWPKALVFFAKPPLHRPPAIADENDCDPGVSALQWVTVASTVGVFVSALARSRTQPEIHPIAQIVLDEGESPETRYGPAWPELPSTLCALWLLLQQRIAVPSRVHPTRSEARRWARMDRGPIPEITTIELRRPTATPCERGQSGFVDWTHRWMVDGFWRNQYHPSTGEHVPTWIDPFVKGPPDKPLVVKRRIHRWKR